MKPVLIESKHAPSHYGTWTKQLQVIRTEAKMCCLVKTRWPNVSHEAGFIESKAALSYCRTFSLVPSQNWQTTSTFCHDTVYLNKYCLSHSQNKKQIKSDKKHSCTLFAGDAHDQVYFPLSELWLNQNNFLFESRWHLVEITIACNLLHLI